MQNYDDEPSFDWADLPAAPYDPHHGVHRFVERLFNKGMTEEGVFYYLVETGIHSTIAADLIAQVQCRRVRLRVGEAARKQSARVAATDPDAAFALYGQPGCAQVVAKRVNERWKNRWFTPVAFALVCAPIVFILTMILVTVAWAILAAFR